MSFWDKDLGIWSWGPFRGTTPRNADIWTFDVVVGKYELWMGTGKHAYVSFFSGPKEKWGWEREPKNCTCYGCNVMRPPTLKEWEKMVYAMGSGDVPTRKLPPRGCHPSDCCGDEEAHDRS